MVSTLDEGEGINRDVCRRNLWILNAYIGIHFADMCRHLRSVIISSAQYHVACAVYTPYNNYSIIIIITEYHL